MEKSPELEDLRNYLNEGFSEVAKEIDKEDLDKIRILTNELKEKYSDNISVEKKVDDIKTSFYDRFKQSFEYNLDIDPGRLLGLTDGIFGLA